MRDKSYDTIVIGAGASGMMAAITAAGRGKSVLVMERMSSPGKKLLATGNGKCNFTNERMDAGCYHGDPKLIAAVLARFSRDDCLNFFHGIGVFPKNKRGYYYPNSEQASTIADALTSEMDRLKVTLLCDAGADRVAPDAQGFVCGSGERTYRGKNVIFASGLLASPKLGSDGCAIPLIKEFGHRFLPILPALCGFYCEGMDFGRVSGVRCDARLRLEIDGRTADEERGELQLADYGLSGIPVFQLSSEAVRALYEKRTVRIHIDFLPALDEEELARELNFRRNERSAEETVLRMTAGLIHSKLIPVCFKQAGLSQTMPLCKLSDGDLAALSAALKDYTVTVKKSRGAEYAQVCTGGVRTEEIDVNTLESKLCPGLYFAGELLDADGICGGYNLQWAWATGYVAGSSVT